MRNPADPADPDGRGTLHCGATVPRTRLRALAALALPLALAGGCAPRAETPPRAPAPVELDAPARAGELAALGAAEAAGDAEGAAAANGRLARDAFARARRILDFQLARADPGTGLLPWDSGPPRWIPKHTGADLWPHLVDAALVLAPERLPAALRPLESERALCGALPRAILFAPPRLAPWMGERERVEQAAEYAADGLLPLVERHGDGPWLERLREATGAILDRATVPTRFGPVPSDGAEANGNLLQVLSRLGRITRDPGQLAMLERLLDVYLLEVIPRHGGLPPHFFAGGGQPGDERRFRLRDHGAEIVPGLAEAWLAEVVLGRDAAARHAAPLAALLERLVELPRTSDGLWRDELDLATGVASGGAIDTWGYLAAAWSMVDRGEGGERRRETVRALMGAAAARAGSAWEGTNPDGPADAIESMLLLLPFHDLPEGRAAVDAEVPGLFARQDGSGSAGAGYLDGNVIRSALLYADFKSQGARARPWRADLALGAARDRSGGLVLRLECSAPWRGRLALDRQRHREIWGMARDHPRRNARPEWFVVAPGDRVRARDPATSEARERPGAAWIEGVESECRPERPLRLRLELVPPPQR
jgi:hypothetical protein